MSSLSSHSLVAKEAGYNAITEPSISNRQWLELVQSQFYIAFSCLTCPHVCYTCSGLFFVLTCWGKTHAADCKWCIDCVQWQEWHGAVVQRATYAVILSLFSFPCWAINIFFAFATNADVPARLICQISFQILCQITNDYHTNTNSNLGHISKESNGPEGCCQHCWAQWAGVGHTILKSHDIRAP